MSQYSELVLLADRPAVDSRQVQKAFLFRGVAGRVGGGMVRPPRAAETKGTTKLVAKWIF